MNWKKRQCTKLVYKLLLLAVYLVFFAVQLFLRYNSAHSQQSLDFGNYQKNHPEISFLGKTVLSKQEPCQSKSISYLNKSFHPKDNVILPDLELHAKRFYVTSLASYSILTDPIAELCINTPSLRGPPISC